LTSWTFFAPSPHQPQSHHITFPPYSPPWKSGKKHATVVQHCRRSSSTVPLPVGPSTAKPTNQSNPEHGSIPAHASDPRRHPYLCKLRLSSPNPKKGFEHSPADEMKLLQGQPSRSLLSSLSAENFQNPIYSHPPMCLCLLLLLLSSLNQPLLLIAKIRFDHNLRSAVFICDTSLTELGCSPTPGPRTTSSH
jgi:hypothetical protein